MEPNNVEAIFDFAADKLESEEVQITRGDESAATVLIVPDGRTVTSIKPFLDEYRPIPERKKGTASLTTLSAFCDYTNRHKLSHSAVFLDDRDAKKPYLLTVFDAHQPAGELEKGEPRHQQHRARYDFPLSDEWKAWSSLPEWMPQDQFALFLEERIGDVIEGDLGEDTSAAKFAKKLGVELAPPSRLLELSRGLSVTVNATVAQAVNLSSGEGHIQYSEEHKDRGGQQLKVPGAFAISIPVFRLGVPYRIAVRLRYQVKQGRVSWQLAPHRTDLVFEDAIKEAAVMVHGKTDITVFRGAPEA